MGARGPQGAEADTGATADAGSAADAEQGLSATVAIHERAFDAAIAARDVRGAVTAIIALEATIVAWSRDTGDSADYEHARSVFRSLVVRLGDLAEQGARDPRDTVAPFIDALLDARVRAREAKDWATSDAIRDRLVAAGVEVRDTAAGTEWDLAAGTDGQGSGPGA